MGEGDRTEFPVIPLGDTVMFPGGMRTFMLGRPEAQVLVESLSGDLRVLLVAEMRSTPHAPQLADLHKVGTVSRIQTWTRTPDGRAVIILAEGLPPPPPPPPHRAPPPAALKPARSSAHRAGSGLPSRSVDARQQLLDE